MRLRGRKGIKEELEQQKDLVVLEPHPYKGRWREFFGNDHPIHAELGMGKGRFISGMSKRNPEINYIGVDMYDELVRRAAVKARAIWSETEDMTPPNLALARFNILDLEDVFEEGELERIYLNFSDPWPKAKHARRRLTHANFVNKYRKVLNKDGEIHFKTDSETLFEFSLNSFSDLRLQMKNISLNLHRAGVSEEEHVMTEYETKFTKRNMPIFRMEVVIGTDAVANHHARTEAFKAAEAAEPEDTSEDTDNESE
ncbi:tRNA (guanine-N7)-methyltransferase [Paenibacillus swuensis]|uniref:tRNA (guanine-N(7)-)-methyltransferase n=1 Tax=Paenibacillus swuensis TaxID=1178515 RepID=A0A172TGY0_9BACL|nr:tRNA (guanosine(46)-N7)-methyltransferase TrmB [Paenibacillus swuensis]ANE46309.1 tRNA (guanine-N7)-methyltransferase [Paenibacillus swuensis]